MLSELNRIEYIISEFLVLAKPQNVVYKERDVRPLLEHIIALAETHAIMHNVQIAAVYEKELPLVKCEENQLKQVFLNLLKNAVEAMSGGGEVRVEVRWEQQKNLLIRFVDQGCGIAEERIPKLGEPFYTTKEKGTGLGLMVSYKIIENHGGTINVISRERKGTTFEIRLPACNP
jgi:signal transduction histidine kinase